MLDVPENLRSQLRLLRLLQPQTIDQIREALLNAGLRPTRQRMAIGQLLLCGVHQHVSADALSQTIAQNGFNMSLATIYNTLNQFADAGLIRKISVSSQRTFFDTNVHNHQHFYIEDEDRMSDISGGLMQLFPSPQPPQGYSITKIDIVVSLQKTKTRSNHKDRKESTEQSNCAACKDCTKACQAL